MPGEHQVTKLSHASLNILRVKIPELLAKNPAEEWMLLGARAKQDIVRNWLKTTPEGTKQGQFVIEKKATMNSILDVVEEGKRVGRAAERAAMPNAPLPTWSRSKPVGVSPPSRSRPRPGEPSSGQRGRTNGSAIGSRHATRPTRT